MRPLLIFCLDCRGERSAEKRHGYQPGRRPQPGEPQRWWNICRACDRAYAALAPGAEARMARRHQPDPQLELGRSPPARRAPRRRRLTILLVDRSGREVSYT